MIPWIEADAPFPPVTMAKKSPDPIDKHVGGRVRMRRMMLGMSQGKLAYALRLVVADIATAETTT